MTSTSQTYPILPTTLRGWLGAIIGPRARADIRQYSRTPRPDAESDHGPDRGGHLSATDPSP